MKYLIWIFAVMMAFAFVSCSLEDTPQVTESSAVESTENTSGDNTSTEASETVSEDSRESWTDTQNENNMTIVTEYTNYGNDWVRTTETFSNDGNLVTKSVRKVVDKEIVEKFDCEYDENGNVLYQLTDAIKDGGKTIERNEQDRIYLVDEEDNVCAYTTGLYELDDQGNEQCVRREIIYKSTLDDKIVAQLTTYPDVVDDKNCNVEEAVYYIDGVIKYYIHQTIIEDAVERRFVLYDAEMNPIYEYHHTDYMAIIYELFHRDEGYIQSVVSDNIITYYESTDGVNAVWVAQLELNSSTGELVSAICNGEYCDAAHAEAVREEYSKLATECNEALASVDYNPLS